MTAFIQERTHSKREIVMRKFLPCRPYFAKHNPTFSLIEQTLQRFFCLFAAADSILELGKFSKVHKVGNMATREKWPTVDAGFKVIFLVFCLKRRKKCSSMYALLVDYSPISASCKSAL